MTRAILTYPVSGWLIGIIAAVFTYRRLGRHREDDRLMSTDLDAWGGL